MEKINGILTENPHYLGLIFAVFGVLMLVSAIKGAKWLFEKDVSVATYNLKKIDGWINMFGVKTARIVVGAGAVLIIITGMTWFLLASL